MVNVTDIRSKDVLFDEIAKEWRLLTKTLDALSDEEMLEAGACAEWSVKDMLAHLTAWQRMFLDWYAAGQRGEVPELPAPGLTWGQTDVLNRRIYEQYRDHSLDEVRTLLAESQQAVMAVAEAASEDELFGAEHYAWTGQWLLYRFVWSVTGAHYRWAKTETRKWLKRRAA